jgi:hypothetical protein
MLQIRILHTSFCQQYLNAGANCRLGTLEKVNIFFYQHDSRIVFCNNKTLMFICRNKPAFFRQDTTSNKICNEIDYPRTTQATGIIPGNNREICGILPEPYPVHRAGFGRHPAGKTTAFKCRPPGS